MNFSNSLFGVGSTMGRPQGGWDYRDLIDWCMAAFLLYYLCKLVIYILGVIF